MSRKASEDVEYTLRSLSSLMGERRRRQPEPGAPGGERSLLAAESAASLQGAELERAARRQFQRDETPAFVYAAAAFSALGGFLFGYDTGVVSGAMLLLRRQMRLGAMWQELLVSGAVGAAAVAALAGGALNGALGRRSAILLASALCTVGSAVLAAAANKETLLAGRLVVGLGIGIASMTVPVYIAEVSPPNLRGRLVTINTLFITGGQFFASVVDGAFSYLQKDGWRYMLGLAAIPAVIQFLGFLFLPESPRWLIQKGQTQKARRILSQMRGNQTIDEEYDSIRNSIEEEEKEATAAGPVICRMLSYPPTRRALVVGCGLQMFQQLSGINTIIAICLLLKIQVWKTYLESETAVYMTQRPLLYRPLYQCVQWHWNIVLENALFGWNRSLSQIYLFLSLYPLETFAIFLTGAIPLGICGSETAVFVQGLQIAHAIATVISKMYYSATILQMSGVEDDRLAIWLASITAFTNFIFTLVGVWLVEKVGRRKLTFGSLAGTTVALIILALGFLLSAQVSPRVTLRPTAPSGQNATCTGYSYCNECMLDPDCGFCYKINSSAVIDSSCVPVNKASTSEAAWGRCENETKFKAEDVHWAYSFCPTPFYWTALVGLVLYLVFFAPGMGPMPWTVNSEIYPLWARSTGNACSAGINWIFNVLVSLTFLHTAEYLTYYGAFFLYAGFAAVGLLFVYGCLPETKGKKLEEIESLFDHRLCTCGTADSDEGRYIEYIRVKGSNYHLSDNDASDVE